MRLDQLNEGMERTRKMLSNKPAKKLVEQGDEAPSAKEVKDGTIQLLADAYTTFLAKVEQQLGQDFQDPKEAFEFLTAAVKQFRSRGKSSLMKKLRVFERMGSQKTLQRAKRGM